MPLPDVADLPPVEALVGANGAGSGRSAAATAPPETRPRRRTPVVRPSPARSEPHDPDAWFPMPALEELLEEDRLAHSGETAEVALTETISRPSRTRPPDGRPGSRPKLSLGALAHRKAGIVALAIATVTASGVIVPRLLHPDLPNITLVVDGETRHIETDADDVAELLDQEHVEVAKDDRVEPGLHADIENGLDVTVFRAFDLAVDLDGKNMTIRTTYPTARELVRQLDLDPDEVAVKSAPHHLGAGSLVVLRTKHEVTINVDGTTLTETSLALNVEEFLAENSVVLGPMDLVDPPRETAISEGMTVKVVRVANDLTETVEEEIPPPEQRREDPSLPIGETRVVDPGAAGTQKVTYRITTADGREVGREPVSRIPVVPARPKIIMIGTALPNQREGTASWYASPFGPDSCATKEYVPKGTILRVTNLETGASTTCRVADRVEANRVVDLDDDVFRQLAPLSKGTFRARIDW